MALVLGELAAVIKADDKPFDEGLDKTRGKFDRFGGRLKVAAAAAGAAAGAALAAGLAGALNVEKANDKLAAQIGATGPEAERLGRIAGDLYAGAWGDSIEHVNTALGSVRQSIRGMATASDERLQAVTAKALDFATAFEIDVARAAQVAGNAVASGLADNAEQAFDLLTKASQQVPPQLREDVLDAVDEYGTFFNTIGIKGPEAFGILAAGADQGMFGIDKAGDAVKEFTIRATDLSTATQDAFKLIGVDTETMTNKILAGGDQAQEAFGQIIDGLLGIKDPGKQAEAAIALFGTPLEDLNTAQIPEFLESLRSGEDALGDVEGAAARMGDQLNDNAATTLESFKRSAKQALSEQLADALPHLQAVGQFLGEHHDLVVPLVAVLGGFAVAVGAVVVVTKIWHGILLLTNAALAVKTGIIAVVRGAIIAWTAAQWLLNTALIANPIGLIILAIAALIAIIVLIATKTTWFQDLWRVAWGGIKAAALAVGRWFRDTLWQKWIVGAFNGIKDTAMGVVGFFRSMPGRIRSAAAGMWDGITGSFRSAINWVIDRWNNFSLTLGGGSVMGIGIPSVTLSTPNIPRLATGGSITRAGVVEVGERGRERLHLPRGATVEPLDSRPGRAEVHGTIIIRGDGILRGLREEVQVQGGDVEAVLG